MLNNVWTILNFFKLLEKVNVCKNSSNIRICIELISHFSNTYGII
jgi:hypothetical protein